MKKKPVKKVFSKSKARKELHMLWSQAVRQRDRYACQWCAHDGKVNVNLHNHAHHIVSRALSGTCGSFDITNGVTLCYYCHIQRLKSEVDEYIWFRDKWLKENVGMSYVEMRGLMTEVVKFTEEYYEERKKKLLSNGLRDDNRPENLVVCKTHGEHMKNHRRKKC